MKPMLFLFCAAVTISAISATTIVKKDGTKCECRAKNCDDDISCAEHNCYCTIKNLKGLQNQKDCKYNKEWVAKRLKIEEKRCRCVKKCEKKWNDVEANNCVKLTYDRAQCDWKSELAEIEIKGTKEAVDLLLEDLIKVSVSCINSDCRPQCAGDSDCSAYLGDAEVKCVENVWKRILKDVKDEGIKDALENGRDASLNAIKRQKKCDGIKCELTKKQCLDHIHLENKMELQVYLEILEGLAGECTSKAVDSIVQQGLTVCNLRNKRGKK